MRRSPSDEFSGRLYIPGQRASRPFRLPVGSGKYATRLPLIDEIGWVLSDAALLGLVDMSTNQKVRLTDAGLAFLDIMHVDNYDPDAFLRFMNPSTMTIAASEIERVDAWMMRFFRKMKTKVNAL